MHQVTIQTLTLLILSVNSFADAQGTMCSSATLTSQTVTGNCPATPPGGTCVFSCAPGYTDVNNQGGYTLRCGNDGRWHGVIPVCNMITYCPDLAPATGGYNSGVCTRAQPGNTCSFSCPPGSQLVGPSVLTCGRDSFWDYQPPTCNAIVVCPNVLPPPQGSTQGQCTSANPGAVCTFNCPPNSRPVGFPRLTCQPDGTWSSAIPTCRAIVVCPSLLPPPQGSTQGQCTSANPGAVCIFSCPPNTTPVGTPTLTCQTDGTWSSAVPTCRGGCNDHTVPINGQSNGVCFGAQPADVCYFSCNPGFRMRGSQSSTCLIDGTWTSHAPSCY